MATEFYWVRHASMGHGKPFGIPPDAASEIAFYEDTVRAIITKLPKKVIMVTSDMRRSLELQQAFENSGLTPDTHLSAPEFREQDFGEWCDNPPEVESRESKEFWQMPSVMQPPGGESMQSLYARVAPKVLSIARQHVGASIVVCAHAGVIRCALALALQLDLAKTLALHIDHLSLTHIGCMQFQPDEANGEQCPPIAWDIKSVNTIIHQQMLL